MNIDELNKDVSILFQDKSRNVAIEKPKRGEFASSLPMMYFGNPDDPNMNIGFTGVSMYNKLANDSVVATCENILRQSAISTEYIISSSLEEPSPHASLDKEIINFIEKNINNLTYEPFNMVLNNLLDARIYGYKIAELNWSIKNNKWMLQAIKCKRSEYFVFDLDDYGNLKALLYSGTNADDKLPPDKFLICTWPYKKDGNYYGNSAYKEIFKDIIVKQELEKLRNKGYEFTLIPSIINHYDNSLPDDTASALKNAINNMRNASIVHIPCERNTDDTLITPELKILEGRESSSAFASLQDTIDKIETRIKRKLGIPDEMGITDTKSGSNAKAEVQFNIFADSVDQMHKWLETQINGQLIPKIIGYNYTVPADYKYPKFMFQTYDETLDKDRAETAQIMVNSGIVKKGSRWLSDYLNIPESELNRD